MPASKVVPATGGREAWPATSPPAPAGGPDGVPTDGPTAPPTGRELLDRLRLVDHPRPAGDPELVAHLRGLLETAVASSGAPAGRLLVTRDRLSRSLACPRHRRPPDGADPTVGPSLACGALVGALFRQLVTVGQIGEAMADGLDALRVDDRQAALVAWIDQLAPPERAGLAAEVARQVDGLRRRWPGLDPRWLPRTQESIRVVLAGGAAELSARIDLALGRPAEVSASVALVDVTSGLRRPEHGADRGFLALVDALRSPAPPFAVATYYTRTGDLDVDPVTPALLERAARRCASGIAALADADGASSAGAVPACATCAPEPARHGARDRTRPPIVLSPDRPAAMVAA